MVTWNITFNVGDQEEKIELFDVATLVDWDPEFKGKYIASFFQTDYAWSPKLQNIDRDGVEIPPKTFLLVVARKWGEDKTKGIGLGILFEFTEGDLKLRGVGPQSLYKQAGGDSNLLLNLVDDLFEKPEIWKTKIIISGKPKSEWRKISDIIGVDPWHLIDHGRRMMKTDPRKAMDNFNIAFKVFDILADINGKFHAMYAQAELALDTMNPDQARGRLEPIWELVTQLGDPMLEENVLSLEGILLYEEGFFEKAISKFDQALDRAKRANIHKAVVNSYCNIGECYYRIGKYDEAMTHFDRARALSEERNDKSSLAITQINIAKVLVQYVKKGDFSSDAQARYYLNEALQHFEGLNDDLGILQTHGVFGNLEEMESNLEPALFHYEAAAEKAQTSKNHRLHEFYRQNAQRIKNKLYEL